MTLNRQRLFPHAAVMILWALPFSASRADIDLEAHRQFLAQNRDLTAAELVSEFGRDVFLAAAPTRKTSAARAM